ncbi:hypothetical protein TOPH_01472 [Tolypocladium ophioglossoides CBS 100239]|uniref:Aminoglycoside phosphotransferase domain-containing protein n=1 Tax=Tolypocladium ophioglossoides (strain CBS 100239) TaxID=1163406 RepID=A0A0L0NHX2_TOLOC|nr:hypothetical protein TOPH_01472 [Tolypocladium ophioglossoides CBS 100239]
MEYAALHTSVCLPRVHRTYQRRNGLFIAMDFVQGTHLDTLWPRLDDAEKRDIVAQIWDSVRQLHACRPPASLKDVAAASISGGPVRDGAFGLGDDGPPSTGPFAGPEDFLQLLSEIPAADGFDRNPAHTGFVHADLALRNIIRTDDGRICIIDWEFAGWWPLYWERIKWHFADFPPTPDFVNLMDELSGQTRAATSEAS